MAYRFKKSETIPHSIQRVFAEEIAWAVSRLVRLKNRVEAVHEARKSIKKIRALLSLVQDRLGPLYKAEDRFFRDAGRQLSNLRDNAVMLEVFDALAVKHPELHPAALAHIRLNLERSGRETPEEAAVSAEVVELLRQARTRAKTWALQDLEFESLKPALVALYREGRKALEKARHDETAENLHELRKRVKQHWYHLRLFENFHDAEIKERLRDLHHLETWLGDQQNLSVLCSRLAADIETSRDRHQTRQVMKWIEDESHSLRKRAFETAEKLYGEKPAAFGAKLETLWTPIRKPSTTAPIVPHTSSAVA